MDTLSLKEVNFLKYAILPDGRNRDEFRLKIQGYAFF